MFFSKELNRLISKQRSNIYYSERLTSSKLVGKVNWSERQFEQMRYEEQKGTSILEKTFTLALLSSAVFGYKTVSQISFNFFCSGDKRLLSEVLRKWDWFQGHNERFPKYLD